jgi:hypothetical protein
MILPPLGPQCRDDPLPVSFAQSRLWLVKRLHLVRPVGPKMPFEWQLSGKLDRAALSHAFFELFRRHESLRTCFRVVDGTPYQHIGCPDRASLPTIDLTGLDAQRQASAVERLRQREGLTAFDLARGPLLRAQLLVLSEEQSVLLMKVHHLIYDGWSHGVLLRELSVLYTAFARGETRSPLPELTVQYADYAIWQQGWLKGEIVERQLHFWRQRLLGLAALRLPTDHPRPHRASFAGARLPLEISNELTAALRGLARNERVTLYMVLLASFQLLLSRWSGQTDIAVGSPTAGRIHPKTEPIIGFFVNTLVMRTDSSGDPSFCALLARVKQVTLDAHTHQHVPFERLIIECAGKRDPSRHPLCQVQFVYQNLPWVNLELPGLVARPAGGERFTARYDLTLELQDLPGGLCGNLGYATNLFEAPTIDRFRRQLQRLLEAIVTDPLRRISTFALGDS